MGDPLLEWFRAWSPEAVQLVVEALDGVVVDDEN